MLTGKGKSSLFMYNGVKDNFHIAKVISEEKVDQKKFLKRRIKRLGLLKVIGQVLFVLFVPRLLIIFSRGRIGELLSEWKLDDTPIPSSILIKVSSVNSKETIKLLRNENPDVVIVNGTRIISKKVLSCIDAIFVNTHVGITPKYRGVHGGYWALVNNDKENCGVTVHLVDTGIDTGKVLYQETVYVTDRDNFVTYPLIQTEAGVRLMNKVLHDYKYSTIEPKVGKTSESKLWYHPTLLFYLYNRFVNGIK